MEMDPERWRSAIGPNAARYLRHFERAKRSAAGWAPGWNWAAFAHSTGWFCYRRMYGWAAVNSVAPILLAIGIVVFREALPMGLLALLYLAAVFIALPVFADSLYFRSLRRRAGEVLPPSTGTGVGGLALGAGWFAMVASIANSGYADYMPPAMASREGLSIAGSIRPSIEAFYLQNRRLPGPDEAARFSFSGPAATRLQHTASVRWDAARKSIVVTLSEPFKGQRFEIAAQEQGGPLAWACRPIDLNPKYLPSTCR